MNRAKMIYIKKDEKLGKDYERLIILNIKNIALCFKKTGFVRSLSIEAIEQKFLPHGKIFMAANQIGVVVIGARNFIK